MSDKNTLKAIDISLPYKSSRDVPFLLSNINFSIDEKEPLAILIPNKINKKNFIDLFIGNNQHYLGLFEYDNNFVHHSMFASTLRDCVKYVNKIDSVSSKRKRLIELIELGMLNDNELDSEIFSFDSNEQGSQYIDFLKMYRYKKIEHSYLKTVNIVIKKVVNNFESIFSDLKKGRRELTEDAYKSFVAINISYLKDRINMIIKRNVSITKLLFSKSYESAEVLKKNIILFNKAKAIIKKIDAIGERVKALELVKKELISTFSIGKESKINKSFNIKENKHFNNEQIYIRAMIDKFSYKREFYFKKINSLTRSSKSNSNEYQKFYTRRVICSRYLKFLRFISNDFKHWGNGKIVDLLNSIENSYYRLISTLEDNDGSENISIKKRNTKFYINKIVNDILDDFSQKYNNINVAEFNESIEIESSIVNEGDVFIDSDRYGNIISSAKEILQEAQWEKKTLFHELGEEIERTRLESTKFLEEYERNKSRYIKLLNEIIRHNESYNKKAKSSKAYKMKLIDLDKYLFEFSKLEDTYNFLAKDRERIKKSFFSDSVNLNSKLRPDRKKDILLIIRYMIFDKAKDMNLNYLSFLDKAKNTELLTLKKANLLLSQMSSKEIIILDDFFSNLDEKEVELLSSTFSGVVSKSDKIWILIEDDLSKINKSIKSVLVIDNNRQIEYGSIDQVSKSPIYDVTRKSLHVVSKINRRPTPVEFENIVDYDNRYDFYQISDRHEVYASARDIYSWIKTVPHKSEKTVSDISINNMQNKIAFDKLLSDKKGNVREETNDLVYSVETREYLVIDVKK